MMKELLLYEEMQECLFSLKKGVDMGTSYHQGIILRGPRSSYFWIPRNLSNHMDRQHRTEKTESARLSLQSSELGTRYAHSLNRRRVLPPRPL